MKFVISCVAFLAAVTLATAMTTMMPEGSTQMHMHHSTREPTEHGKLSFFFDRPSNYLILNTDGYCYFMSLNTAEQALVHNPDGLRRLETQALHMMTAATHGAMRGGDHSHISRYVYSKLCANEHLIKLMQ